MYDSFCYISQNELFPIYFHCHGEKECEKEQKIINYFDN